MNQILVLYLFACSAEKGFGVSEDSTSGTVQEEYGDSSTPLHEEEPSSEPSAPEIDDTDEDNDGTLLEEDCDDNDSSAYPDAEEICDGKDNNCDGIIDEGVTSLFFIDNDGDGFGSDEAYVEGCEIPEGFSDNFLDCDDGDASKYPANTEICDGLDNNCDGQEDEGLMNIMFPDDDGDGVGTDSSFIESCSEVDGYSLEFGDCDDNDPSVFPDAEEICDAIDNDCNGVVDEGVTSLFFIDEDGDGFGYPTQFVDGCEAPEGYSAILGDCDDDNSNTFPSAIEVCDEIDNNCDGIVDEGVTLLFFVDLDEDGFGDVDEPIEACETREGISDNYLDCNDLNMNIRPTAIEFCDNVDNNCNEQIDEGVQNTYYEDFDVDGYGDVDSTTQACSLPTGYVENSEDCDDTDDSIHPSGIEVCDTVDNNCDDEIDIGIEFGPSYYRDQDEDGFGDNENSVISCFEPDGYVSDNTDCDDDNNGIYPNADELCDGVDENCDEIVDNDATNEFNWYFDGDGDGYGTESQIVIGCEQPNNFTLQNGDCDDQDNDIYPLAPELCNGENEDCDDEIDEESIDRDNWYIDLDDDGFGDENTSVLSCSNPEGYVSNDDDCDDSVETGSSIYPNSTEICDDVDNDCDGEIDEQGGPDTPIWYLDDDGDGYGNLTIPYVACDVPEGYVGNYDDCDDSNSLIYESTNDADCDGIPTNVDCDDNIQSVGRCMSCAQIQGSSIDVGDGNYEIELPIVGILDVYCDMTSEGGGWTLAGHQHPTEYFTFTTEDINIDTFNPELTFRYGNEIIQQMIPSVAWRITSNDINSENLTDNAWFRPECVIDWNMYTGVYADITTLDTDCGIAYTDENFTDSVGGNYTESNCSLGIGQNNSGTFCSIRMGSCDFGGHGSGVASPCDMSDVSTHSVKLWYK